MVPEGLEGAVLRGRAAPRASPPPPADAGAGDAAGLTGGAAVRRAEDSVDALGSDPRGAGVLLPEGYVVQERVPVARTGGSRRYKVYIAPNGAVLQSRAEAWRRHSAHTRHCQSFTDRR